MNEKITAIILSKNEQRNIIDCIKSVAFCDEIILIDDNSSDNTVMLAKKAKVKIIQHDLKDDFSQQRNVGLSQSAFDWVLFVDSDERVTPVLGEEIKKAILNPEVLGYYIKRADYMGGKRLLHGETGHARFLRLGRKNAGKWSGKIHEKWIIKGQCSKLNQLLLHYPHQTISEFLSEINYYTTLRAKELFDNKIKVGGWQIWFYPCAKFVLNFFLKLGFLDGARGMMIAVLMSFHSFLVRGKLWHLQNEN